MSIKELLLSVLKHALFFVPRDKKLWVYGAWDGKIYSDNSKYIFEYVSNQHNNIKSVWITTNPQVFSNINGLGYICYMRYSIKGIWAATRAGAAFITSSEGSDISPLINYKKTKVIELWHGFGAKLMRYKDENGKLLISKKDLARFRHYYWMASSEKCIDIFSEGTGSLREHFYITGYPRNDTFIYKPQIQFMEELKINFDNSKFIIYMPTHRKYGKESVEISEFKQIDAFLQKNNIVMVYKPHFHELQNLINYENEMSNIILAKDQLIWGDVYSYIHYFDLLISDYSSISYDFLCADKPIVQYVYDLDHYKKEDFGLSDFFEKQPLGPFCFTWEETLKEVKSLLEKDTWHEKREICRILAHPFDDGKNCKRVYETVYSLLH